jgi:predicted  nucleic acid-binding Zn-ribbon protein
MKDALGDINKNKAMNELARDLSIAVSLTDPFRQKLSTLMDEPSRLAGQFDSSMRNIQSLTGETNESLGNLQKELLAIGSGTVAGPNAIADAYYNIASGISEAAFGADVASVRMGLLETASRLAEAGQANLDATAEALNAQTQSYESRVARLQSATDALKIQMGDDINNIKIIFW